MTAYHEDNLPETLYLPNLPDEAFDKAFEALGQAVASGRITAKSAVAGYLYERKDDLSTDRFGGKRNPSYGGPTDDMILQITVRVPNPVFVADNGLGAFNELEEEVKAINKQEAMARLEAEIEEAQERGRVAVQKATDARIALDKLINGQ